MTGYQDICNFRIRTKRGNVIFRVFNKMGEIEIFTIHGSGIIFRTYLTNDGYIEFTVQVFVRFDPDQIIADA